MKRALQAALLPLLVGCAPAREQTLPPSDVEVPVAPAASASPPEKQPVQIAEPRLAPSAIFVPSPEKVFTRRARVDRVGNVRLLPDVPPAIENKEAVVVTYPLEPIVLESGPERVRILHTEYTFHLAAYLDTKDLREVPVREVELALTVGGEPVDARVVLSPGSPVSWTGERPGERRARVNDRGVDVSGWMKKADVGRVFGPSDRGTLESSHYVERRTTLHLSSRGAEFAVIDAAADHHVRMLATGDPRDGRQKVTVQEKRFLVEGWIDAKLLVPEKNNYGYGTGRGHGSSGGRPVYLPAGTTLHATPGGEQIGLLIKEARMLDRSEHRDGHGRVGVRMHPWGTLDAWAPDDAFEKARLNAEAEKKRNARFSVVRATVTGGFDDPQFRIELERREILGCVEKVEAAGTSLSGELRLTTLLDKDGSPEKLTLGGPLAKNRALAECVQKEVTIHMSPDEQRPRPGTLDATVRIAPKAK